MSERELRPPPWDLNLRTRLYHGTTSRDVGAILQRIDVRHGERRCDFGQGFYTTTLRAQAWEWAQRRVERERERDASVEPAVVYFDLDRNQLALMDVLFFVRRQWDSVAYWSLVWHCREGRGPHRRGHQPDMYDVVVGPVSKVYRRRYAYSAFDQISVHTDRAAQVFDAGPKGEIGWTTPR